MANRGVTVVAFGLWGLGGALGIWLLVQLFLPYKDVAAGVTAPRIRRVRIGMNPEQVTAVLGRPLSIESYKGSPAHKIGCPTWAETVTEVEVADSTNIGRLFRQLALDTAVHACHRESEWKHDRQTTFTYSRPGNFLTRYPMLWVHFDKQARVREVYAKEYALDDVCIYSLSPSQEQSVNNQTVMDELFGPDK